MQNRIFILIFTIGFCCTGFADGIDIRWNEIKDVQGNLLDRTDARFRVVCFLGVECPLARLYAPRLESLAKSFGDRGFQFIGINSNAQDSVDDIRGYAKEFDLSFPIVRDGDQSLAKRLAAKRTPEVVVLGAKNEVLYRGRIDDQYMPGITRAKPTREDLRLALASAAAGEVIEMQKTDPVGCLITFRRDSKPAPKGAQVTFFRDVAPVLNKHCVECHRAGEIGPFELTQYEEVVGWAEMILEVVDNKRMPPWHADPKFGRFVGARHFPEQARDVLAKWLKQGMPRGDAADAPKVPEYTGGWQIGKPEQILEMRSKPFKIPAEGTVEYQYFVVDPGWKEDRWVRAAQVIPGNASVVHHAIVFVRPPDGRGMDGIGWVGGYVPGQRIAPFPPGHARMVPAGSKLVFQMHYTPNGRSTEDLTRVGFRFIKEAEVTHTIATQVAIDHRFEINPNDGDKRVDLSLNRFSLDSKLLGISPHMHLRGKSFKLDIQSDTRSETVLSVPRYDFNWQHWYQFKKAIPLRDVRALKMEVHFDNSADNPTNPNPTEFVRWGDQTWEEMAVAFIDVSHPRDRPRRWSQKLAAKEDIDARRKRAQAAAKKFIKDLDKNNDGVVERDETDKGFRRFGFYRFDRNNDGRIDMQEAEWHAMFREQR